MLRYANEKRIEASALFTFYLGVRTVAFDLFKPVPDAVIDAIVDEIFLPLVRLARG